MSSQARLTLCCPDCGARLVVDAATGEVIHHKSQRQAPAGGRDLESLFEELERGKAQAEDVFQREVAAMKDRDRLLDEKFEEALRRAEEEPDEGPPARPFDLD